MSFEKASGPFWYFTKHGVQPGSVPKDIRLIEVLDAEDGTGTYFLSDKVIDTKQLHEYELKEMGPGNAFDYDLDEEDDDLNWDDSFKFENEVSESFSENTKWFGVYQGTILDPKAKFFKGHYNTALNKVFKEHGFGPLFSVESEVTFKPNYKFVVKTKIDQATIADLFGDEVTEEDVAAWFGELSEDLIHDAVVDALYEVGIEDGYSDLDVKLIRYYKED